jgi:hypothetical protein
MRPSYIIATKPEYITGTDSVTGAVLLGVIGGVAYAHIAPYDEPVRLLHTGGNLIEQDNYRPLADGEDVPEDAVVMVVGEQPPFPWGDDYTLVYDPSPEPFTWDAFALAHPELGASPGTDADGNPLPPPLMPHMWAGE